jgi:hypothetical protein
MVKTSSPIEYTRPEKKYQQESAQLQRERIKGRPERLTVKHRTINLNENDIKPSADD